MERHNEFTHHLIAPPFLERNFYGQISQVSPRVYEMGPRTELAPDQPYFVVQMSNVESGRAKLIEIVEEANSSANLTRTDVMKKIRQELPSAKLYDSHEEELKRNEEEFTKAVAK